MVRDEFGRGGGEGIAPNGPDGVARGTPNGGLASLDEVLRALAHPTRRAVLYHLQDRRVATADELASAIVARRLDVPVDEAPADACEQAMVELVHTHLPRLADSMFIEYDPRSRTATYTVPIRLLDTVLGVLAELERELGA